MGRNILVIGATSLIAYEFLRQYCEAGDRVALLGRNIDECQRIAADLAIRNKVDVRTFYFDADAVDEHEKFIDPVKQVMASVDLVLFAIGTVHDQSKTLASVELTKTCINSNFLSIATVTGLLIDNLRVSDQGKVVLLSSVAGDRGRAVNFTYGASKAAANVFMQGLRQYLHGEGIQVYVIKLGFTDTRMVYGEQRKLFCVTPAYAAKKIVKAIRRNRHTSYVPFLWKWVMTIITMIPEKIFVKLKL